jgi:hypothetical protein
MYLFCNKSLFTIGREKKRREKRREGRKRKKEGRE